MGGKKASRGFELAATYTHIQTSCKCGYIASAARERLIGALDEFVWVRVQLDDYRIDPEGIRKGNIILGKPPAVASSISDNDILSILNDSIGENVAASERMSTIVSFDQLLETAGINYTTANAEGFACMPSPRISVPSTDTGIGTPGSKSRERTNWITVI